MSETAASERAELEALYATIEEAARLIGVPCSPETVWPVLDAYGVVLARTVSALRVATGPRHEGDLDCRFILLPKEIDPYDLAVSKGLTPKTDHPSAVLLADIRKHCAVDCYGIDFGVVGGFKKTWTCFPADDMQEMAKLAEIPSMPPSLAANIDLFARYGMHDSGLIGIDHDDHTMNVYFGAGSAECVDPDTMLTLLRELGLPEPSDELVKLGQQSFGIYVTLDWDSLAVARICFAATTPDPTSLPVRIEPHIEEFIRRAPQYDNANRRFVYAIAATPKGEYHKLQSYLRWRPQLLDIMLVDEQSVDHM
jgi:hypothetical protein